jgi:hypothetical protein
MFSELPRLLDRNFALGYLIPSVLLLAGTLHLLVAFQRLSTATLSRFLENSPWLGATGVAVVAWLLALALLAGNRFLVRLREGYLLPGWLAGPFRRRQIRRWKKLRDRRDALRSERKAAAPDRREELESTLATLAAKLAREFPDGEHWILPTAFGNVLRAFEVYPRVLYGAESTVVWPRLLAIASDAQRDLIDQAKAQVDLWVNLGAVVPLLLAEYVVLVILAGSVHSFLLPLAALLALPVISWAAFHSALSWGSVVKATFDVYLPELHEKLGLPRPGSRAEQRAIWRGFSQAVLFHLTRPLPELSPDDSGEEARGSKEG